jgi:hypothetical protein
VRAQTFRSVVALSLMAAVAVPAVAEVHPTSAPFRVNRTDDFKQMNPVAAFSSAGSALEVWENDQRGIRGLFQRLDGTATSAQLNLVANETLGTRNEGIVLSRKDPSVAFLVNGQFLLGWTEQRAYVRASPFFEDRQIQDQDVFVQRFNTAGDPVGSPVRVNSVAAGFQSAPKVTALPNGGALILWRNALTLAGTPSQGGIGARMVNAAGQPVGAEIKISDDTTADHADVAVGRNGFLVVWDAKVNDQIDVFGRLYENSGKPLGNAFRINTATAGNQRWPAVAVGADNNFLVAWQGYVSDRSDVHIHGQFLSPVGGFLGKAFRISSNTGTQLAPSLAATKTGFVATWLDGNYLGYGIEAVELSNLGARLGEEIRVADSRVRPNYRQSIAADGKGGFLIPWETNSGRAQVIVARGLRQ